jgi:ElaB/YqjD/DUF883 family membrane-anchored ribosome-binding protein
MDKRDIEINELKAELDDLGKRFKKLGAESSDQLVDQVKEYVSNATDSVKDSLVTARKSAVDTGKQVHKYAQENPWQVAGMAAAVGFVLALLARNNNRD